jgi:hypothetical protein
MKKSALRGKYENRAKIILNGKTIEHIENCNYLGCDVSFNYDNDLREKYISICMSYSKEGIKKQN